MNDSVVRIDDAYSWNITRLGEAFGLSRETIRKRLVAANVAPTGSKAGINVYAVREAAPAIFEVASNSIGDPNDFSPTERRAWYQSENERLKLELELRNLVPADEVHREMSAFAKAITATLDSLPDVLERDCGLSSENILRVQDAIDGLRDQMFRKIIDDEPEQVTDLATK